MIANTSRTRKIRRAHASWLVAFALCGCTAGVAEPVYSLEAAGKSVGRSGAGAQSGTGGTPGNSFDAGTREDGGNGNSGKTLCDMWGLPTGPALDQSENDLLTWLNDAIDRHLDCAGHALNRRKFDTNQESLRCYSRYGANVENSGMTLPKPPSQGPGRDPFSPGPVMDQFVEKAPTATKAQEAMLADSAACTKLQNTKYTEVGIGHAGNVWVVTLSD
jgi:hypothetical protein